MIFLSGASKIKNKWYFLILWGFVSYRWLIKTHGFGWVGWNKTQKSFKQLIIAFPETTSKKLPVDQHQSPFGYCPKYY